MRCCACSRRRTTSAAPARAVQEGARRDRQGGPAGHRAQEAAGRADRGLGGRAGGRPLPGAGARAALQDPVQARQERPRVQGRGRGAARAARAAGPAAAAGAIDSPYQFHWRRFLFDQFPKGTGFPPAAGAAIKDALPLAAVQAFSIDDSATTEIDDALSVQGLGSGTVVFGIHIAAPGLAITPGSPIDKVARASAVHRLHAGLEDHHAARRGGAGLHAGRRARLPGGVAVRHARRGHAGRARAETRLERVPIAANLRHDQLDASSPKPR
jgi:hypothetical protein